MPVYLCKPGWGTAEPWRHGMPVYAHPFPMKEESRNTGSSFEVSAHHGGGAARQDHNRTEPETRNYYASSTGSNFPVESTPIRRVRHSEVVLVDEVSLYYGKYWLRLRWPGSRGGVAGYIVLGDSKSIPNDVLKEWKERLKGAVGGIETLEHNKSTSAEGTGHSRSSENSVGGHSGSHHEDGKLFKYIVNYIKLENSFVTKRNTTDLLSFFLSFDRRGLPRYG
jgi:hypothetical protein